MIQKKAQQRSEIVWWIIAILALVAFSIFIWKLYIETPIALDREACRESVAKRNLWLIKELPESLKPELKCKTQDILIKSTNEEVIKREIANSMYECWDVLGRGKAKLFDVSYGSFGPEANSRCIVCSRIAFSEDVEKKIDRVDGIVGYMYEENVPRSEITYWQFLTNDEDVLLTPQVDVRSSLDTSQDYAVILASFKKLSSLTDFASFYGGRAGAGAGTGAIVGSIIPGAGTAVGAGVGTGAGLLLAGVEHIKYLFESESLACDGEFGCSSLLLVPYNAREIGANCEDLQSIP